MALSETRIKNVNWEKWSDELSKFSKDELIKFILKKSTTEKREVEKAVEINNREIAVLDSYSRLMSTLNEHMNPEDPDETQEENLRKAKRIHETNEGKRLQIKNIKEQIKKEEEKIEKDKIPRMECNNSKREAQNHITKKVLKKAKSQYKKGSNMTAVHLLETFCGCLIGKEKASEDEVIHILSHHDDLMSSMNRLEESKINREHAKRYSEVLKEVKHPVTEKENLKLIPFYVWLDNVFRNIKYSIEEKQHRQEIEKHNNSIYSHNNAIEQNNIILDHIGYDPVQLEHYENVMEFWNDHSEILEEDSASKNDKIDRWDEDHAQSMENPDKKKLEEKKFELRREYPEKGKSGNKDKAGRASQKSGPKQAKGKKEEKKTLPKASEESKDDASDEESDEDYSGSADDQDNSGSGSDAGSDEESSGDNQEASNSDEESG